MTEKSPITQQTVEFAPAFFKWLFFVFSFLCIGFLGIVFGAFMEEGFSALVLWGGALFFLLFLVMAYYAWTSFQRVVFFEDEMVWIRPGFVTVVLPYDAITEVELRQILHVKTRHSVYWLNSPFRNVLAQVQKQLTLAAPAVGAAWEAKRQRSLPIEFSQSWGNRLVNVILMATLGLFMLAFGIGPLFLDDFYNVGTGELILQLLGLLIAGAVGGLLLWISLTSYVWSYYFTESEIIIRHPARTVRYPVSDLKRMRIDKETRHTKRVPRDAWFLQFELKDGQTFNVEGSENGGMTGYTPTEDEQQLRALFHALKRHYFKTQESGETKEKRIETREDGVLYVLDAELYGVEIKATVAGEQSAGVDEIIFTSDPPMVGLTPLATLNGQAVMSENQRFVAIWTPTWLFVLDLARKKQFWLRERQMWSFAEADFDEKYLHVTLVLNANRDERATLNPIPLEDIEEILIPNEGLAEELRLPQDKLSALLNIMMLMPTSTFYDEFETLRDKLAQIGLNVVPDILTAARQPTYRPVLELLVMVLSDYSYPPAAPDFITWLDHENDEILFASAMALDRLAGERFGIDKMISKGWVQYDRIRRSKPAILDWWTSEGKAKLPSHAAWRAYRESKRPLTEREKWFNFVALNPQWVKQGNGIVQHPINNYKMPRHIGIHTLGGEATLPEETHPRFAAIEVDSSDKTILSINVKINDAWVDVIEFASGVHLNHAFES